MSDYRAINRANWDERVPVHVASPDYAAGAFAADPAHLSDVVSFDRPRLGDLTGLRGIHLMCHLGTDTVSLARLGARMTGLDFSPPALAAARDLAELAGQQVDFLEADVYDAVEVAGAEAYDLVYTGIGALCWLPSVRRWAGVIAALLRPGGRLFLREGHPVLWSLDDRRGDGVLALTYPYFEQEQPTVFDEDTTYVQTEARITSSTTHEWNHGLGEIVTAVLDAGLTLTALVEHDSVPWQALPGLMRLDERDEWRLVDGPERLPCSYTLQARKPGGPAG